MQIIRDEIGNDAVMKSLTERNNAQKKRQSITNRSEFLVATNGIYPYDIKRLVTDTQNKALFCRFLRNSFKKIKKCDFSYCIYLKSVVY